MRAINIFGVHAVSAALARHGDAVLELWVDGDREDAAAHEIRALAETAGVTVQAVREHKLAELAGSAEHQGVVARRRPPEQPVLDEILGRFAAGDNDGDRVPLILVLDRVQDPHNLGACLRLADAASVDAILLPTRRAAHLSGAVYKVASGAAETVPLIEVGNLGTALEKLKDAGVWLTGLTGDAAKSVFELDYLGPSALVLGNEHEGLRHMTRERCDFLARIPMAGIVESLNVATAAAVCVFEAVRQRAARPA